MEGALGDYKQESDEHVCVHIHIELLQGSWTMAAAKFGVVCMSWYATEVTR